MSRHQLHDDCVEIIASALHYHDHIPDPNTRLTAMQVTQQFEGWVARYRNDRMFNARVQSMVAGIMLGLETSIEREVSERLDAHLKMLERS